LIDLSFGHGEGMVLFEREQSSISSDSFKERQNTSATSSRGLSPGDRLRGGDAEPLWAARHRIKDGSPKDAEEEKQVQPALDKDVREPKPIHRHSPPFFCLRAARRPTSPDRFTTGPIEWIFLQPYGGGFALSFGPSVLIGEKSGVGRSCMANNGWMPPALVAYNPY
jgi:hypothetical protein